MSVPTLQILSDLHLEVPKTQPAYTTFTIEPHAPYLALLGDIGNTCHPGLFTFLEAQLRQFQLVFFLLGNHEFYGSSVPAAKASLKAFATRMAELRHTSDPNMGHFVFLDQTRYDLTDSCTVLGCTLYSHVPARQTDTVARLVSDFARTSSWSVAQHNAAHTSDLAWLNAQVSSLASEAPTRSVVILTHHSPTLLPAANDPAHLRDARGIKSAFVADLSEQPCWRSPRVRVWAFGHTHFNCDLVETGTGAGKKRVLANQRGYAGQAEAVGFEVEKVVRLPNGGEGEEERERKRGLGESKCVVM